MERDKDNFLSCSRTLPAKNISSKSVILLWRLRLRPFDWGAETYVFAMFFRSSPIVVVARDDLASNSNGNNKTMVARVKSFIFVLT